MGEAGALGGSRGALLSASVKYRLEFLSAASTKTAELMLFKTPVPRVSKPKPSYQQRTTRDVQPVTQQLSLF